MFGQIAEWLLDDDVNSSKSVLGEPSYRNIKSHGIFSLIGPTFFLAFIQGMISFVDEAIKRGENVLVRTKTFVIALSLLHDFFTML